MRLISYDYSFPNAYFVTIVTHMRQLLFGIIANGAMVLNQIGEVVKTTWLDIPTHFPSISLGAYNIMPNHFHGMIIINDPVATVIRVNPRQVY